MDGVAFRSLYPPKKKKLTERVQLDAEWAPFSFLSLWSPPKTKPRFCACPFRTLVTALNKLTGFSFGMEKENYSKRHIVNTKATHFLRLQSRTPFIS